MPAGTFAQAMLGRKNFVGALDQQVLTASSAKIVDNTSGQPYAIDRIILTEKSGTARTVTLRVTANTGGADNNTEDIMTAVDIAANEVIIFEGNGDEPYLWLPTAYSLKGLASAATAVNCTVSYRTEL